MRTRRLKAHPDASSGFYHCMSRVVDRQFIFGDIEKEHFARLMRQYPLVAIGGLDLDKLPAVLASGAGSVAVVRAITSATNPEEAAHTFMRAIATGR